MVNLLHYLLFTRVTGEAIRLQDWSTRPAMLPMGGLVIRFLAVLTVPVVLMTITLGAPVPRDRSKEPPLYFPTRVGAKWVYQTGKTEQTEVVTKVRQNDEIKVITVAQVTEGLGTIPYRVVEVSARGLVELEVDLLPLSPPVRLLSPTPGDRWNVVTGTGPELTISHATFGPERVKVPAGVFQALRVEGHYTLGGNSHLTTYWYAPGVGMIKAVSGDLVTVLKAFTPGQE
jgi:hypothetical protein